MNKKPNLSLEVVFQALSSSPRLEIVKLLANGGRCVNCITQKLDLSQSVASQHLRVLRLAGLVESKKHGKHIHYFIRCESVHYISEFFEKICTKSDICACGQKDCKCGCQDK
jgi:DNA-binding transcriptional ArsR family regulator